MGAGAYVNGAWVPNAANPLQGMQAGVGASPIADQSSDANRSNNKPSDQRFRSFAERYLIERCRLWAVDGNIDELAWKTIAEAKTVYKMVLEQGRTIKE